jgi:hypothetical protein
MKRIGLFGFSISAFLLKAGVVVAIFIKVVLTKPPNIGRGEGHYYFQVVS